VEACRLTTNSQWHAADETVSLQWFQGKMKRTPQYGEEWLFHARITAPRPRPLNLPAIPETTASAYGGRFLQAGRGDPLTAKCLEARAEAARILTIGISDHHDAVETLNSLLLGYRSNMPHDAYRAYTATGTIHIFAIDGFHVVVQAAVIIFALGVFRIPRTRWIFFLAPMLIIYTVMTGLPPSALRACIMAIIYWSAPLFGRKSDVYAALAASAILILAVVPSDLMSLGFILSFVVVLGLVLLYPVFERPLRKLFAPDPLRLQPEPHWIRFLRAAWRHLSLLIATSCAAWLVSAPLTAYYFQMFSLIALAGNLIAMPLASLMIVTGALSLVFGSCIEWFADVFNHANLALAFLLTKSMEFFAAIPGGNFPVDPPTIWLILAYYLALAAAVLRFRDSAATAAVASVDATKREPETRDNRHDGAK
jgi:ComEC/Rec2-related protein